MAGILTNVCLWHAPVTAVERGYNVRVVADANGTSMVVGDDVTGFEPPGSSPRRRTA